MDRMRKVRRVALLATALVLGGMAGLLPGVTWSKEQDTVRVVDGVRIVLGLLPSEMVQGHPAEHAEVSMHGGTERRPGRYHILIALFDAKTSSPIQDAEVLATVSEPGLPGVQKQLEPMKIGDNVTFGNYFAMSENDPHVITVRVQRRGAAPIEARFEQRHR